jgi:hypothetical protein
MTNSPTVSALKMATAVGAAATVNDDHLEGNKESLSKIFLENLSKFILNDTY